MNFKKFLVEFTSKNVDDFLKAWKSITKGDPALPNGRARYHKQTYVNLIPYRYSGKIHLEEIKAMEMGKGHGTETLKLLCKLADRYQVPISLHAVQLRTDGPAKRKLIEYYRRFGFQSSGADDHMERTPNAPITENESSWYHAQIEIKAWEEDDPLDQPPQHVFPAGTEFRLLDMKPEPEFYPGATIQIHNRRFRTDAGVLRALMQHGPNDDDIHYVNEGARPTLSLEQKQDVIRQFQEWSGGWRPDEDEENTARFLNQALWTPNDWKGTAEEYNDAVYLFFRSSECELIGKRMDGKDFLDDLRESVVRTRRYVLLEFLFPWAQGDFHVVDRLIKIAVNCGTEEEATKLYQEIEKIRKNNKTWFMFDYSHLTNLFGVKNVIDDGALYKDDMNTEFMKSLSSDDSINNRLLPKIHDSVVDTVPRGYKRVSLEKFREATYSGRK